MDKVQPTAISDEIPIVATTLVKTEVTSQQPTTVSIGDIVVKINNSPVNIDNDTISKIIEVINMLGNNQQIILGKVANLEITVSELQIKLKQLETK